MEVKRIKGKFFLFIKVIKLIKYLGIKLLRNMKNFYDKSKRFLLKVLKIKLNK